MSVTRHRAARLAAKQTRNTMDTTKFSNGWAVITLSGRIPSETAKLRRALVKRGARKLAPQTYALPHVAGQNGVHRLSNELFAVGARETRLHIIYITRSQWERGYIIHGLPAIAKAGGAK